MEEREAKGVINGDRGSVPNVVMMSLADEVETHHDAPPALGNVSDSRERIRRNTLKRAAREIVELSGLCSSRNWLPSENANGVLRLIRERLHETADVIDSVRQNLEAETKESLMTEPEAAEYFGVSVALLKKQAPEWESAGAAVRIGKKWRFRRL